MKLIDKLAEDFNSGLHEKQHTIATNQAAYKAGFRKALEMVEKQADGPSEWAYVEIQVRDLRNIAEQPRSPE